MKITVAGTGYVGLVTGVCLAELGHHVTCIDIQSQKIKMLQSSLSPIYEPGLEPLLIKNQSNNQLNFTTNPQIAYTQAEIIFIEHLKKRMGQPIYNTSKMYAYPLL